MDNSSYQEARLQLIKMFNKPSDFRHIIFWYDPNGDFLDDIILRWNIFLDDKIWNVIIAVVGVIAYGIVGLLYSIHLIDGKQEGKTAYAAVFIILIIIGFLIYQGILKVEQWILSWPLAVKIIVPTLMGLLIVGTIVLLVIGHNKKPIEENQEESL